MHEEMNNPPQQPTPPTVARPIVRQKTSSWPTVIGIISIVYSALGILGSIGGMLSFFFMDGMQSMATTQAVPQIPHELSRLQWVSSAAMLALAVMLLIGGIALLKSRPKSATILKWWAGLTIALCLFSSVINYRVQQEMFEEMQRQNSNMNTFGPMGDMFMIFSLAFGVLFTCAYPTFILIWFSRKKIRDEVGTWH